MKRTLATKPTKKSRTDQPSLRRNRSPQIPPAEAGLNDSSKKVSLTEEQSWERDIATLRQAAAERAALQRNGSPRLERKTAQTPIEQVVRSLADGNAAFRKMSLLTPQVIDRELTKDESWKRDMATLRQAAAERALLRNQSPKLERRKIQAPIQEVVKSSADAEVRKLSVQALYDLDPDRAASVLNIALRDGSLQQRREIGAALAASGVVDEAINNLMKSDRDNCYGEFSLLFLVAKAGEVQPLIRLIEKHPNIALRLAVVSLLASSGGPEVLSAFRRLALSGSLATEVQLALLEAINQITNPIKETTPSAA
ncbi:MAG TPA: hypothetical protein VKB46_19925 [Pyrinomonadaceae bacterium]|nr:hypothetical protein [Pyrinomonadaceae bacterium]